LTARLNAYEALTWPRSTAGSPIYSGDAL
jgi:hypothetical protein